MESHSADVSPEGDIGLSGAPRAQHSGMHTDKFQFQSKNEMLSYNTYSIKPAKSHRKHNKLKLDL